MLLLLLFRLLISLFQRGYDDATRDAMSRASGEFAPDEVMEVGGRILRWRRDCVRGSRYEEIGVE